MEIYANKVRKKIEQAMVYPAPYQEKYGADFTILTEDKIDVIKIRFDTEIENLVIRPLRYQMDYKLIDRYTAEIYPKFHCNFSVEPNGDLKKAVLMFYGKAEQVNKSCYENVIYFKAGRHFVDKMEITQDNTLVFLEEDAIVDGQILFKNSHNIAVDGFGILTYEKYNYRTRMILCEKCSDVEIRNLTIHGSTNWNVCLSGCDRVHIENVKILGYHGNSDGIDVCGSRDVLVEDCFTRVWDDSLVVKGFDTGDIYRITFRNCVLWNDFARPMEIGVEIRAEKMYNILFEDIELIHSMTAYPIMGIHHGDRAEISDVVFQNINIEHNPGAQLFDLHIRNSAWNKDEKMGRIHDVTFKNINVLADKNTERLPYHSRILGYAEEHDISDVSFENIRICGKAAQTAEGLGLYIGKHVSNVRVTAEESPYIEQIKTRIQVEERKLCEDGFYDVVIKTVFENTSDVLKEGTCDLKVSPSWIGEYETKIDYQILPANRMEVWRHLRLPAGKYGLFLGGNDADLEGCMEFLNLELFLTEDFENSPVYRFKDSYGNDCEEEVRFAMKNHVLMIKSELIKKCDLTLYVADFVRTNVGEMLFSVEDSNAGVAPAMILGDDERALEAPQIGCPEEIAFVFENYPKVNLKSVKIHKKLVDTAYIPLSSIEIGQQPEGFLMELVLHDKLEKRYEYALFGSPIPKETIREPRVLAHMFVNVKQKK